jgi:hypothetical protein
MKRMEVATRLGFLQGAFVASWRAIARREPVRALGILLSGVESAFTPSPKTS